MKLIVCFISFLIFSCSKDDGTIQKEQLIGSWKLSEQMYGSIVQTPKWEIVPAEDSYTLTFYENSVVSASNVECDGSFDYSMEQQKISLHFDCINYDVDYLINKESTVPEILIVDVVGANMPDEGLKLKFLKQ